MKRVISGNLIDGGEVVYYKSQTELTTNINEASRKATVYEMKYYHGDKVQNIGIEDIDTKG